jgi:hypothetical protein
LNADEIALGGRDAIASAIACWPGRAEIGGWGALGDGRFPPSGGGFARASSASSAPCHLALAFVRRARQTVECGNRGRGMAERLDLLDVDAVVDQACTARN